MKLLRVIRSPKAGKKWRAVFDVDGRETHTDFGSAGMTDYTLSGDAERAKRYRLRHQKDLETNDPRRAGYLSFFLLWASPDFEANIRMYRRKFHL